MEKNKEKKRAYFQHLIDINGANTLFQTLGQEMNYKGITNFLKDNFGDDDGDVAADMSKRAGAVGNSKLMGFSEMDLTTGRNKITVNEDKQINIALAKNREKYDQNFARQEHFDSLVDQDETGNRTLSKLGIKQLVNTGQSKGRIDQIRMNNFQDRYGKLVVELDKDGEFSDTRFKKEGLTDDEINAVRNAVKQFGEYYDPEKIKETKERKREEKQTATEGYDIGDDIKESERKKEEKFHGPSKITGK